MFRSRRSCLIRRLWKARKTTNNETECTLEDIEEKSTTYAMLKRLKEEQLNALLHAIETFGAEPSDCVSVLAGDIRLGRRTASPHVFCCQLWRWPDIKQPYDLKKLACCKTADDSLYICCNPYHWSKVYKPESPPPPYSKYVQDCKKNRDCISSEVVSVATNDNLSMQSSSGQLWCYIAYWEQCTRVGRLYPVFKPALNIFSHIAHGDGLCLATLAQNHVTTSESVLKTREKIGLGLMLSKEDDGVWIYNRSEHSVFFNSPTLDPPSSRNLTVHKVPPGHSVKVFDYYKSYCYRNLTESQPSSDGPFDPHAIRISFAKGWGPRYSRRFVTSCPCWLEILLSVER